MKTNYTTGFSPATFQELACGETFTTEVGDTPEVFIKMTELDCDEDYYNAVSLISGEPIGYSGTDEVWRVESTLNIYAVPVETN